MTDALFTDVAEDVGLDFVHFNGMSGEYYFPEMTGQGAAFLDYDRDGDLDVYLVQGAMLGDDKTPDDAWLPHDGPAGDRLFRNDLVDATGGARPRFVDVTDDSGIRATEYGMGVATGDVDGDGFPDLYLANFGANQLLRNGGDGVFADDTARSGTGDPRWSVGASFLDHDRDGDLDLFVVNYVEFSLAVNPRCYATSSRRDYCGPSGFAPSPDALFANDGTGIFRDATLAALTSPTPRPGLGAVATDVDGDGAVDLFVTNDGAANQLWLNQGDGTFLDDALLAGVAFNRQGEAEASMGVDAADFDGDGDEDLFVTHLTGETNTLYVNDGAGLFEDRSIERELGAPSFAFTGFGTGWIDYDNDGWLDLFVANGAVRLLEERAGSRYPLDQTNQLFRNEGGRSFEEMTGRAGPVFELSEVSRGAAFGDVDNDGDTDVLLANNSGRVRLLLNHRGDRSHWLGLRLVTAEGADVPGARVAVSLADGRTLWRRSRTDGSYASAHDPRVVVGLGAATEVTALAVTWPDGVRERWPAPPIDDYWTVRRGSGQMDG